MKQRLEDKRYVCGLRFGSSTDRLFRTTRESNDEKRLVDVQENHKDIALKRRRNVSDMGYVTLGHPGINGRHGSNRVSVGEDLGDGK